MWLFTKKNPKLPLDGKSAWDISPETKGRWNLRVRRYWHGMGPWGGGVVTIWMP